MSLLQQDSPVLDDAARGEELTKGSSHLIWPTVIAAIIATIAVAIYVVTEEKPPAATGQVVSVVSHLMHRETSGVDANGVAMPKEHFDQVLVFTHVKLHNQSKQPLFVRQIMSNITLDDGIHTSYAAIPADYERIFVAYPDLASLHGKPILSDATIPSGETLEGDFVSAFRIDKSQWDGRKGLDFDISFRYLPDLKLAPTTPVSDR
jgi:hypothetical protein